jgi:hypothetical protein
MEDAVGLVDGLYPGSGSAGFRKFPGSGGTKAPRIGEVYTRGTLTLARLGREAPIAAGSPAGPALRDPAYGSAASAKLYPEPRQQRPSSLPSSPVVGTDSPVQYPPVISWRSGGEPEPEAEAEAPEAAPTPAESTPAPAADPDAPKTISWKRG